MKHKILPKMSFDTSRPSGTGRPRVEVIDKLRRALAARFENSDVDAGQSSMADLDLMIGLADGNNGIVNYWLR